MKKLLTAICLCIGFSGFALDPNHFTITRISAPYFLTDANDPAILTSAYVGFEVKNNSNSATTYSNLKFTINSISSSIPAMVYSVVSPASGIINVGTLAPGQTKVCYYYIKYPASKTQFPIATFNVTLSDNTASSKTAAPTIYNRAAISANAGGVAIQSFSNQDLIGGIVTDTVTYTVGNVRSGDETDFQVAVSPQFDPTKILLLSTKVHASSIPQISAGATDSLYFITGAGSSGATVTVIWTFKIAAFNFTTYLLPCAGATSGNTNYKYALNSALGQGAPVVVSSNANPLTITKTSNKSIYLVNELATFCVSITNPGAFGITIDKIVDQLPAGFTFQSLDASSQVSNANSTTKPAGGSTGSITFEGGVNSGSNVSYFVPAGGTLILKYTALAPGAPTGNLTTTVRDYVGDTEVGSAQNTVAVVTTLPVKWLLAFAKKKNQQSNIIQWQVQENEGLNYMIEFSTDGINFTEAGKLFSKGNGTQTYTYEHTLNATGKSWYRILQTDKDGKISISPTMVVQNSDATHVQAFPNPSTNFIQISSSQIINGVARLIDAQGKTVQQFLMNANQQTIDLQSYSKGAYWLVLPNGEQIAIIKQ